MACHSVPETFSGSISILPMLSGWRLHLGRARGRTKKLREVGCVTVICSLCFTGRAAFIIYDAVAGNRLDLDTIDHPITDAIYYGVRDQTLRVLPGVGNYRISASAGSVSERSEVYEMCAAISRVPGVTQLPSWPRSADWAMAICPPLHEARNAALGWCSL
eukprot:scaffold2995_cov430-Prasinococcus_capsulatus_cf.AAC.7